MSNVIKEVPLYFLLRCNNCGNKFRGDIDECPKCNEGPGCLEIIKKKNKEVE